MTRAEARGSCFGFFGPGTERSAADGLAAGLTGAELPRGFRRGARVGQGHPAGSQACSGAKDRPARVPPARSGDARAAASGACAGHRQRGCSSAARVGGSSNCSVVVQ